MGVHGLPNDLYAASLQADAMKRLAFILLFLPALSFAAGPKYAYQDPRLNDEMENIYHDITNVPNGRYKASSMTLQGITVDSATIRSATITTLNYLQKPVQATYTGTFSTANAAYQASGFTVAITPTSASNRVMVTVNCVISVGGSNQSDVTIYRNGSDILSGTIHGAGRFINGGATTTEWPFSYSYIDSPASTSTQTYELRIKSSGGTTMIGDATISMIAQEIP
jgi:hypothetical protein